MNGLNKIKTNNMKTELEEAAANLADPNICKTDNWIAGANYQAERSYSEEEVLTLLLNRPGPYLTDDEIKEWFEQYKKK
jgi:hypothetical protein